MLIHTAGIGPYMPHFRSAAGSPLLLEEVLTRHPKLRLFVENAGYPYRDEIIAMMYQYPQLYADISTMIWVIPRTAFTTISKHLSVPALESGSCLVRIKCWPEQIGEAVDNGPLLLRGFNVLNAREILREGKEDETSGY